MIGSQETNPSAPLAPWPDQATGRVVGRWTVDRRHLPTHRAQIGADLNDITGSIASLEKAASLAPESASVFYTLSQAYQRANRKTDSDRALAEFRRLDALEKHRRTGMSLEARGTEPNPPVQ